MTTKNLNTQTEEEFQNLMPISGTVDTFFGEFELDHSFPTHEAAERINDKVVQERDRLFMYWLRTLGSEKGKPFNPTERQHRILEDGTKVGEMMAKRLRISANSLGKKES